MDKISKSCVEIKAPMASLTAEENHSPPQTVGSGLWSIHDNDKSRNLRLSTPPLQGSEGSAPSSINSSSVSWNNGGGFINKLYCIGESGVIMAPF